MIQPVSGLIWYKGNTRESMVKNPLATDLVDKKQGVYRKSLCYSKLNNKRITFS
jgi:hypothetical protein